jgi:hypothetical protein
MKWVAEEIIARINATLPEGSVVPQHTDDGHFYRVMPDDVVYPSVTGKLQIIKDESIANFKANRALDFVFANYKDFTEDNILKMLEVASHQSSDILEDAGDIGSQVHEYREEYFNDWIKEGKRPEKPILSYIPEEKYDIRAVSALRALESFVNDYNYVPLKCEMLVYSHELKTAGTLDDLGFMDFVVTPGDSECDHKDHIFESQKTNRRTCVKCGYKVKRELVLLDLKTSNRFKDHYFFQVALYYLFFKKITGIKPDKCIILKVDKENGKYKIEDLKRPARLAMYGKYLVKTSEGIEYIKSLRKDNQRKVLKI